MAIFYAAASVFCNYRKINVDRAWRALSIQEKYEVIFIRRDSHLHYFNMLLCTLTF